MILKKLFIGLSSLVLITTSSCESHKEHHHHNVTFTVTSPVKKDTLVARNYVAQIHAIKHIELRALEKGYLQKIFVDEGQTVKQGQHMFKIMPNVYESDLERYKAEAEIAFIEYKNTKTLADKNVVSQNELALAKAKLDKANAEVKLAQTHLNFTDINAPFTGIMDHLHVREGSLLDEGELLTTLSDNSKMWVYFNVPEAEYLNYALNNGTNNPLWVDLELANGQFFNQKGKVETIEGEFNNETGNIAFRATFDNPQRILRHGETGNIVVKTPYKNAILIPQKATFEVLDKKYVFVIDKDNKVQQREIKVAEQEIPYLFIVTKGLNEKDRILLDGLRKVKNGEKIAIDYKKPETVLRSLELYAE